MLSITIRIEVIKTPLSTRKRCLPTHPHLVEAFLTVWTLVAFFCVMRLQVSHLSSGIGERLVAVVTVIRLFTAVHQLVALQVSGCGEELSTHVAAVASFACVPFAVQVEQADLTVALPTGRAAVRLQWAGVGERKTLQFELSVTG